MKPPIDVRSYNRDAWNEQVRRGNPWTVPVGPEQLAAARRGELSVVLTPTRPVPQDWFPPLRGLRVLALAASGGQQAPLLAAAGAQVTVLDNSPAQLAQDRAVAEREGLTLELCEGDMRDLSRFADASFDLVFHPCSNCFVQEVRPVWQECARVLRDGGVLLAGLSNPIVFVMDPELEEQGILQVRYSIPYSDVTSLTDEERRRYTDAGEPLAFGHTLEELIGGQLENGFVLTSMFEDRNTSGLLAKMMPGYIATRAVRIPRGTPAA